MKDTGLHHPTAVCPMLDLLSRKQGLLCRYSMRQTAAVPRTPLFFILFCSLAGTCAAQCMAGQSTLTHAHQYVMSRGSANQYTLGNMYLRSDVARQHLGDMQQDVLGELVFFTHTSAAAAQPCLMQEFCTCYDDYT